MTDSAKIMAITLLTALLLMFIVVTMLYTEVIKVERELRWMESVVLVEGG